MITPGAGFSISCAHGLDTDKSVQQPQVARKVIVKPGYMLRVAPWKLKGHMPPEMAARVKPSQRPGTESCCFCHAYLAISYQNCLSINCLI